MTSVMMDQTVAVQAKGYLEEITSIQMAFKSDGKLILERMNHVTIKIERIVGDCFEVSIGMGALPPEVARQLNCRLIPADPEQDALSEELDRKGNCFFFLPSNKLFLLRLQLKH